MHQQQQMQNNSKMHQQQQQNDVEKDSIIFRQKLRGPTFDTPGLINIENIIKTMKQKTKENKKMLNLNSDIDKILNGTDLMKIVVARDIPGSKTERKGRQPKKNKSS
jgi:hypothetical protein